MKKPKPQSQKFQFGYSQTKFTTKLTDRQKRLMGKKYRKKI